MGHIVLRAYQYNIRYKPTEAHGNADGLFRLPMDPDDEFDIKEAQEISEVVYAVMEDL